MSLFFQLPMLCKRLICLYLIALAAGMPALGQRRVEPIPYGDFDRWLVREIKESLVIGGNTQRVYEVAPPDTIRGAKPYTRPPGEPWGSSNVMADVAGIIKTSNTVFPERRDDGWCARLETMVVKCRVLGLFNIKVVATGTLFLGEPVEPIRNASNPLGKIDMGIPFTGRPSELMFDYQAKISDDDFVTKANGMSVSEVPGRDYAQVFILLQNRTEHADGNITARRVGTGKENLTRSTGGWVNDHRLRVYYGDIRKRAEYQPFMDLIPPELSYYSKNSRGKMVPVHEEGWASADTPVTHLVVMLSSGCYGAYTGSLGNRLWVDNVRLVYE